MATSKPSKHRWRFFRAGGVDQVSLRDGADLLHLHELDPKLWVALAMPTTGVHIDAKTLAALDEDKDGRVRLPEVLAAVRWAGASLTSADELLRPGDRLALDAIADDSLRTNAQRILANLGKGPETREITIEDVADTSKIFAATRFNGDGVIPVDAADDEAGKKLLTEMMELVGSVPDLSGKPGIDRALADKFFAEVEGLAAWADQPGAEALPLGAGTAEAAEAAQAVRAKIDDFFHRCRLTAIEPRAAAALAGSDAQWGALGATDLSSPSSNALKELPLAPIGPQATLPFDGVVNPAWSDAVAKLAKVAAPLLGGERSRLTFEDWTTLKGRLAAYDTWLAEKPATAVEKLGLERVKALAAGGAARATVNGLLERDLQLAPENAHLTAVEKLLLCKRDLLTVLHNFVNFSDFYGRRGAVFQAGTLYLDGRGCNLCLEVSDAAKHGTLAGLAGAYLAYCDCTRAGGEKMTIAAAFTDGDSDNLMVGRNGVFFDRKGRDWDATITKIVANPISLREAFWSPYKKVARLVESQFAKRAEKSSADADAKLATQAGQLEKAEADKKAPEPPKPKIDVGTVAAIGVAIGGIGAMLTGILSAFFGLGLWMPLGLLAVILSISGAAMLLAFLKLRQRNLGPLLDANGWAVNGRARINVPFGGALTDVAKLPPGSERSLKDPYAEKSRPWGLYLFLLLLVGAGIAWYLGRLDNYLPPTMRSAEVLGHLLPGAAPGDEKK